MFFHLQEVQLMLVLFEHFHSRTEDLLSLPIVKKNNLENLPERKMLPILNELT